MPPVAAPSPSRGRWPAFARAARRDVNREPLTSEPKRDWALGPISGHRLRVAAAMVFGVQALYVIQNFLWPSPTMPASLLGVIWSWGSLLWIGAVVPGLCGLIGLLIFRHPTDLDEVPWIPQLVCWRIVTRGTNAETLTATVRRCQAEMRRTPLFPYVIEVVSDHIPIVLPEPASDVRFLQVPMRYATRKRSLFKARALHYAATHSLLPDDAWIVHLDEETQPTPSGIKGIARMIAEEEESGAHRIGQGALLYHRQWQRHPLLTLADNVRTGDDFARFHFGHRLGITVFGLHGSFIVARNDLEKAIGFDVGPQGSITEDAFWALMAMERGHRCRWVEGYLEEQSTQSLTDFVKQRRRWFQGLAKVALHAPVALRWRLSIGLNTALWALAPFAVLYTLGHLLYGFEIRAWVRMLANASFASFATLYLIGLRANLDEHGIRDRPTRLFWYGVQLVMLPAFTALEAVGVLYAILRPSAGFHVVKK